MMPLSGWSWACQERGSRATTFERVATEAERREIASALDLVACDHLSAAYTIEPLREGRYRLSGRLTADIVQACVVTLEPVASHLSEPFDVEFWPAEAIPEPVEDEQDVLSTSEPEPIMDGIVDAGRIVYEHLAGALDPYPRKQGAVLQWQDPVAEAAKAAGGSFAALSKLKRD